MKWNNSFTKYYVMYAIIQSLNQKKANETPCLLTHYLFYAIFFVTFETISKKGGS